VELVDIHRRIGLFQWELVDIHRRIGLFQWVSTSSSTRNEQVRIKYGLSVGTKCGHPLTLWECAKGQGK
jgi:hypothetical protein